MNDTLPTEIGGPSCWRGAAMSARDDWIYRLDAAEIDELGKAAAVARETGERDDVTRADFPLPHLAPRLAALRRDLGSGRGFAVIKGVPVDAFDEETLALILWGIGAHIGVGVSQSYLGDRIGHVLDLSHTGEEPRGYHSPGALPIHTDPVDAVGLLCLSAARRGGLSRVVSAAAAHDALLADSPEMLAPLYRGFHYLRREVDRGDEPPLTPHRVPVFMRRGGAAFCTYLPRGIAITAEYMGGLDEESRAALACFDAVLNRPDMYIEMAFAPGDIQLLNNRLVLHGRTPYEDHADRASKRHLLRIWLMVPEWPKLPAEMRLQEASDRAGGGIPKHEPPPGSAHIAP